MMILIKKPCLAPKYEQKPIKLRHISIKTQITLNTLTSSHFRGFFYLREPIIEKYFHNKN